VCFFFPSDIVVIRFLSTLLYRWSVWVVNVSVDRLTYLGQCEILLVSLRSLEENPLFLIFSVAKGSRATLCLPTQDMQCNFVWPFIFKCKLLSIVFQSQSSAASLKVSWFVFFIYLSVLFLYMIFSSSDNLLRPRGLLLAVRGLVNTLFNALNHLLE